MSAAVGHAIEHTCFAVAMTCYSHKTKEGTSHVAMTGHLYKTKRSVALRDQIQRSLLRLRVAFKAVFPY